MSRFRHALAARDAHIWSLRAIIAVLFVLCAGMWYGWQSAPDELTVHNPPDLRSGSTRKWWVVPPATVYSFAFYIWQQIQRWPVNARDDYKANLQKFSPYLTPSCQRYLARDYEARRDRNELKERERGLYELPGRGYRPEDVRIVSRDQWVVELSAEINEYLHATPVRNLYIRYYLRVVRADVDPETNPWGLQLDCFAKPPVRLSLPDRPTDDTISDAEAQRAAARED